MIFGETRFAGVYLIDIERQTDERGFFARTWCQSEFAGRHLVTEFVQHGLSFNRTAGTLRGLHFQAPPYGETKIVRCLQGALYDVIVDIRPWSPTFRQWTAVELTGESRSMLYIPAGFAHGFQTLEPNTEVSYMISTPYVSSAASGIRYDDPFLAIDWPLPVSSISARDRCWPGIGDIAGDFAGSIADACSTR